MHNDYYVSWDEFQHDTRTLARALLAEDRSWRGIIAVTRGGLVPAAILARELNLRYVDTLCIASYEHQTRGDAAVLKPAADTDGDGFLLVDDLVDTGSTAKLARQLLPRAHFVTVYAKPAGRPLAERFIREVPQDTWIHFPWDTGLQYVPPLTDAD